MFSIVCVIVLAEGAGGEITSAVSNGAFVLGWEGVEGGGEGGGRIGILKN